MFKLHFVTNSWPGISKNLLRIKSWKSSELKELLIEPQQEHTWGLEARKEDHALLCGSNAPETGAKLRISIRSLCLSGSEAPGGGGLQQENGGEMARTGENKVWMWKGGTLQEGMPRLEKGWLPSSVLMTTWGQGSKAPFFYWDLLRAFKGSS